jgi:hypothetical protein
MRVNCDLSQWEAFMFLRNYRYVAAMPSELDGGALLGR